MDSIADDRLRETEAALMRRIQQAERDGERLRRANRVLLGASAGALLLAGASLLVTLARTSPERVADAVEARRFVLRDARGGVRATLATRQDGSARVLLTDGGGMTRLQVALLPDGSPGITFSDAQGRPSAVLGQLSDQTTSLVLADPAGITRAVLGYSPVRGTSLVFAGNDGTMRAGLGVDAVGEPTLTLVEERPAAEPPPAAPDTLAPAEGAEAPAEP